MKRLKWLCCVLSLLLASTLQAGASDSQVLLVSPQGTAADKVVKTVRQRLPSVTLLKPSDERVAQHMPVPLSGKPWLALGKLDSRGQLSSVVWSQDCSDPSLALRELEAFQANLATLPRISEVRLSPSGPIRTGQSLKLVAKATPSARLAYRVGNGPEQQMLEQTPGTYLAEHRVRAQEVGQLSLSLHLSNFRGEASHQTQDVLFLGLELPKIVRVDHVDSRLWLVQGTANGNVEVHGKVAIPGVGERSFSARTDEQGRFQSELALDRWIGRTQANAQLEVRTSEGEVARYQQTLSFQPRESLRPIRSRTFTRFNNGFGAPWGWWGWGPMLGPWGGFCR